MCSCKSVAAYAATHPAKYVEDAGGSEGSKGVCGKDMGVLQRGLRKAEKHVFIIFVADETAI